MIKNQKGITLIALVITIIVLLILAGVSIAMLTGENGILTQATDARDTNTKAGIAEKVNMSIQAAYMENLQTNNYAATALTAAKVQAQYATDNGESSVTGTAVEEVVDTTSGEVTTQASIKVVENSKTYTVTLTRAGKSFTTSAAAVVE